MNTATTITLIASLTLSGTASAQLLVPGEPDETCNAGTAEALLAVRAPHLGGECFVRLKAGSDRLGLTGLQCGIDGDKGNTGVYIVGRDAGGSGECVLDFDIVSQESQQQQWPPPVRERFMIGAASDDWDGTAYSSPDEACAGAAPTMDSVRELDPGLPTFVDGLITHESGSLQESQMSSFYCNVLWVDAVDYVAFSGASICEDTFQNPVGVEECMGLQKPTWERKRVEIHAVVPVNDAPYFTADATVTRWVGRYAEPVVYTSTILVEKLGWTP